MIEVDVVLESYRKFGYLCDYEAVAKDIGCTVKEVQQTLIYCMHHELDEKFIPIFIKGIWTASQKRKGHEIQEE